MEGDLRLSRGAASDEGDAEFGRLEIFSQGGWGSVCESVEGGFPAFQERSNNAPFAEEAVDVACNQLGFEGGVKISMPVPV